MIELYDDQLTFSFPEVHAQAVCHINFQRTLRIPDDNRDYPLPPGLGRFPVAHVDDYTAKLPESWGRHGGVFIPMYQSEALWIKFKGHYPCAIKVAAGKINAVSGKGWQNRLMSDPQDYVVIPKQPWLDGLNVSKGFIRQFVAMPLGKGFTAEEQITGQAKYGGVQITAYPMKREVYSKHYGIIECLKDDMIDYFDIPSFSRGVAECPVDMGLAPGGLMRQEIYEDTFGIDAWDQENGFRCYVHLANSAIYQEITGHAPPHTPPTAKEYTEAGLPWFEYYSDAKALKGTTRLGGLKSLAAMLIRKGEAPLADNDPVQPTHLHSLGRQRIVREGEQ